MSSEPPGKAWETTVESGGARIKHTYVMTEERAIALTESRLKSLGLLNSLVTGFSAAAAASLTKVIDFAWDSLADGNVTRQEGLWVVLSIVGVLLFGVLAVCAYVSRRHDIKELFDTSKVIRQ